MIHIILFGPPGCGKGTQARILENKFGLVHLSTGMIFRHHIKTKTSLGKLSRYYINRGILVPDKITTNMLNIEIKKYIQSKGIIYDGYPRTKNQVFSLEKTLKILSLGRINIIFSFGIKKKLLINRLLKRGKTSHRDDDSDIITVQRRIEEYKKITSFIWDEKKWKNNKIEINASSSVKEISFFIEKKILNLNI
ncbi:nucleoside monophosphate kinase [Blattabacterium sp. (Cryptocercus kyebangensis)]|uniref:nucleoside monophosphate kinase n=1 Tax=Blattabacterium sp. (Cryptocercus kyebangensis) TaxID=298656 RepID=UPI000D7B9929|nr:nucleoside monophosphate kinase [Blattabacterium sp. (Cryptocercus kyebangensis)]AWU43656.1 nucleoside monophosphate kinase [Blattabacterium sp. (Cryptocercus kyebangensis)]